MFRLGLEFLDRVLIPARPAPGAYGCAVMKSIAYDFREHPEFLIGF
jgi:hypothetical protein